MNFDFRCIKRGRRQEGAALIVSLMFLVMMTLIGVTAMTSTNLEEKMAGNSRDYNLALQAAEAALRDSWIHINGTKISGATGFNSPCAYGLCLLSVTTIPVWASVDWSATGPSIVYGSQTGALPLLTGTGGVSQQPRYFIELIPYTAPGVTARTGAKQYIYRATARGFGGSNTAQATLQATFKRP